MITGTDLEWEVSLADFPATDARSLVYSCSNSTHSFDISSGGRDGTSYTFSISAAESALLLVGKYQYFAFVLEGSTKKYAGKGDFDVLETPSAGVDLRTDDEIALDNIRALIRARALEDHSEYVMGDRSRKKVPLSELQALEAYYVKKIKQTKALEQGLSGLEVLQLRYV